jgi:SAM-dependent methyltransferase
MTVPHDWDASYAGDNPPPWDIGRPQPAFVRLADQGLLSGRLLDPGCGTGEHTLLAAIHGADAAGVDISAGAIDKARHKASERGLTARFEVGDALALDRLGLTVDTVLDCGLFHVFDDTERTRYVESLASVLDPGGGAYLMCMADREPGDWGPKRIRRADIEAAFVDGWTIIDIAADTFDITMAETVTAQAWLATIERCSKG